MVEADDGELEQPEGLDEVMEEADSELLQGLLVLESKPGQVEKTLNIEGSVGSGPINKVTQRCKSSHSVYTCSLGCYCLQNMGSTISLSILVAIEPCFENNHF